TGPDLRRLLERPADRVWRARGRLPAQLLLSGLSAGPGAGLHAPRPCVEGDAALAAADRLAAAHGGDLFLVDHAGPDGAAHSGSGLHHSGRGVAGVALELEKPDRDHREDAGGAGGDFLPVGLLLPDMGRMQELFPGAWRGLWLEKNSLGNVMVKSTVFMIAAGMMAPERRKLWFGLALLPVLLIFLSTSKTALVVLFLSMAAMGFVAIVKSGPLRAVIATWLAVVVVIGAGLLIATETDTFFALLGKDATLT